MAGTKFEVTSATVVQGAGADRVMLHTNLPEGIWPWTDTQTLHTEIAAGDGPQYVRHHFGIEPKVIKRG